MNVFFLADFSVIRPEPGLLIWTTIIFLTFWFLMSRFAFGPIQKALKKRETDIQESLDEAKRAREEMGNLKADNERLLIEAREERAKIIKEAKEAKTAMIEEAKSEARAEAKKLVENAKESIENQRKAAMIDLKNQVGLMSIEIAEKVIRRELGNKTEQEGFVKSLVDDIEMS